jgi:uncharacterized protein (DUF433 family)
MNWRQRIVTDADACGGRPRIKGTRIAVEFLLGFKSTGWTEEHILDNTPQLALEDPQAVFAYVQTILEDESYVPVAQII